ncbi:MAG: uroporphyrinogen decarboxylase family protein [Bacteroidetes bacterium]|nr:uroporphyrinogen decarboxylase family protein [Bacteroidota bacterium]
MNKKQKFDALFAGTLPADETLFYPILMHFAARFNGTTYGSFASDYKTLVESNLRCLEYFDMDIVSLISDPYRETAAFGAPVEFVKEGVPVCKKHIVETLDDVINLPIPDVYKNARTLDRIHGVEYYQKLLKGTVPVMGWIEGPLAEACDLVGVSEMLMMLMMDEDFCDRLMDKCLVVAKAFAKAQIEAGADLIGIGDAICSQIDPDSYVRFVKNRHMELVNYIHSLGAKVKLHICGNTSHLLSHIAALGIDLFDPDYLVDQAECAAVLGDKVARFGNINPVFVQDRTAEEVFEASKNAIAKEKGKMFILSAGCEITVNTPVENLYSMSRACKS